MGKNTAHKPAILQTAPNYVDQVKVSRQCERAKDSMYLGALAPLACIKQNKNNQSKAQELQNITITKQVINVIKVTSSYIRPLAFLIP